MENLAPIRLTQTVQKGGCAAKVAALELKKILAQVRFPAAPPELLVGSATFDDAAIYRMPSGGEPLALVQTLDFFTPIVDTPRLFGQIAAANALSDVYAMGGRPSTAMAIFAFPLATMDTSVAVEVIQGAVDTIKESGAALVGGHTIDDETMKFGLSVTGLVHPDRVWTNAAARPGDVLLLTKPLGTGTLTAALKRGDTTEEQIYEALVSMCRLNNAIDFLSVDLQAAIHAATDVTGFGLAGHALNMARASGVTLELIAARLPRFEMAEEFLRRGFLTKAHRTNADYVSQELELKNQNPLEQMLFYDPQTSGGLLLSVAAPVADQIIDQLRPQFPAVRRVGRVETFQHRHLGFL